MKRVAALVLSALILSSCSVLFTKPAPSPGRALGPGEQWVPFQRDRSIAGIPVGCAGVGWVGNNHVLAGSANDPRLVWMMADGKREELEFPVGYSARFTPGLQLLDQTGKVVGEEGTVLVGGCEYVSGIWWVDLPQIP